MKKKINVIDVFIILAVVFSLLGVGVRMYISAFIENHSENHIITLKFSGISEEYKDKLKVGEEAEWKDNALILGEIIGIESVPHKTPILDGDKYTEVVENGKIDMTVRIRVTGEDRDSGFRFAGKYYMSCGMSITVETVNFEGMAVIMDISHEK